MCNLHLRCNGERPLFGNFLLEENLDGGWFKDVSHRESRLVVTTSLFLSAIVGLLILVFAGTVVYGAKKIAEATTRKIVSAERES